MGEEGKGPDVWYGTLRFDTSQKEPFMVAVLAGM